jgi:hypothetical protein
MTHTSVGPHSQPGRCDTCTNTHIGDDKHDGNGTDEVEGGSSDAGSATGRNGGVRK